MTHACLLCSSVLSGRQRKYCSRKCKELAWGRSAQQRWAHKRWELRTKYGLTLEQYELLRNAQGNGCAICGRLESVGRASVKIEDTWLHVDHDHNTGEVRGLLCSECNIGLGKFADDPDLLRQALSYLEVHQPNYTP